MVTRLKSKAKKGKLRFKLPPLMRLKQGVTLTIMSCTCASVQHDDYIYSPRRVHKANIKTFHKSRFCGHKSQFFLFLYFNPTWPRSSTLESDQSLHKFRFFFKNNVSRKSSFILTRAMNLFPADNHNVESSALLLHLWIFCI